MTGRLSRMVLAVGRIVRLVALTLLVTPVLLVRNLFGPHTGPRTLRWYFETCGGGYVKIGQLLATRYDLLRVEYTDELGRLLDSLRPVPTPKITHEIERGLGQPLEELFASFESQPLATASLAQVHGAVLPDGDEVVVKVLKPGIGDRVRVDLRFLRLSARVLDLLPLLRGTDVSGLIDDLSRTVVDELDLGREAMYTAYLHELMAADPIAHYAPRVYRQCSCRNVLTQERIRGVTVREMLSATTNGNSDALAGWAARGITPQRTAVILLRSVLEQTMRYRSFNADPHPSNLIVSDGGTLNWVDFGAVGWMDERQWDLQLRLRDAIAHEQIHGAYLALLEAMEPLPYRNLRPFEQEMKRILSDYLIANRDPERAAQPEEHGRVPAQDAGHAAPQPPAHDVEHRAALPDDRGVGHRDAGPLSHHRLARPSPQVPARPGRRPGVAVGQGPGHLALHLVPARPGAHGGDRDDGVGHAPAARHRPPDAAHAVGG